MIPLPVILNGTKCSEESRSGKNMEMTKCKLGDLCRDVVDCPHSTPEWKSEGVHVIRNFNIKKGTLDFTDGFYVDEETYQKRTQRAVPEESDLVISREAPMGAACIIPKLLKCCLGQRLVLLKINRNMAEPKYVLYAIQSDFVQQQIRRIDQTGSIVSNLNIPDLKSLLVPVPSLSEQKKIAAVLSALDNKIALNKKMNQKLEAMAKRLYDYWFVQFDFPDENGRPYKTSGGPMTHNPTLNREIPEGWDVVRLGDLFKTNRGISYSTPTLGEDGDGTAMINLASFSPNESYNEKGIKYYKGDYASEKILKPYDLVMCNTQQTAIDPQKDIIGRSMLVPDIFEGDIVSSHHVNTIKLAKDNLKFYLNRLFNTTFYHSYISKFANGTNILGLIFSGVENYMCEIPPENLLDEFARFSLNIEKKKSKIILENKKLTALRDKLLPLLMNGQVEVK